MATYKQIKKHSKDTHGFYPESCWIAHMKEVCGIHSGKVPHNRRDPKVRKHPCPENHMPNLIDAFKYFKMLPENFDTSSKDYTGVLYVYFEGGVDGKGRDAWGNEPAIMTFNSEGIKSQKENVEALLSFINDNKE